MMRWTPVTISRGQAKDGDRVGGMDYWLPWPEGLPLGPPLAEGDDRPATPEEHAAAEQILGDSCRSHGLLPVRSYVEMRLRPRQLPRGGTVEQHLVVWVCGYRWVHSHPTSTRDRWATVERITLIVTDADWLREARATLGLTQEQLAEALHLSPRTVQAIEQGARALTRRTRAQVEALLAAHQSSTA